MLSEIYGWPWSTRYPQGGCFHPWFARTFLIAGLGLKISFIAANAMLWRCNFIRQQMNLNFLLLAFVKKITALR